MEPERYQIKRRDFVPPPGTKEDRKGVTRRSHMGNPFDTKRFGDNQTVVEMHKRWLDHDPKMVALQWKTYEPERRAYQAWEEGGRKGRAPANFNYFYRPLTREEIRTLRGKHLGCNCKLDEPCHADVLLRLANAPEET
jgi:hypothetical protein